MSNGRWGMVGGLTSLRIWSASSQPCGSEGACPDGGAAAAGGVKTDIASAAPSTAVRARVAAAERMDSPRVLDGEHARSRADVGREPGLGEGGTADATRCHQRLETGF